MIKWIKFLEKMWLMLAILTFLIGLYYSLMFGVYDALYFFGFSVISILLFTVRRQQRRHHERKNP